MVEEEDEEDVNCYKIQIASVINEIVHRHSTLNQAKLKAVLNIEDDFIKAVLDVNHRHNEAAKQDGDMGRFNVAPNSLISASAAPKQSNSIPFKVVKELIKH